MQFTRQLFSYNINVFYIIVTILLIAEQHACSAKVFPTQMSTRVVETQYGRLRGVLITLPPLPFPPIRPGSEGVPVDASSSGAAGADTSHQARRVEAYYGLQYASVLGGELRFMPPTGPMEKVCNIKCFY